MAAYTAAAAAVAASSAAGTGTVAAEVAGIPFGFADTLLDLKVWDAENFQGLKGKKETPVRQSSQEVAAC